MECVVPRFYFHVREGEKLTLDTEGTELADLAAVRHEAVHAAKEALIDAIRTDHSFDHQVFEIADEDGAVVFKLPFREAVRLTR
jgi:hypothetical protein